MSTASDESHSTMCARMVPWQRLYETAVRDLLGTYLSSVQSMLAAPPSVDSGDPIHGAERYFMFLKRAKEVGEVISFMVEAFNGGETLRRLTSTKSRLTADERMDVAQMFTLFGLAERFPNYPGDEEILAYALLKAALVGYRDGLRTLSVELHQIFREYNLSADPESPTSSLNDELHSPDTAPLLARLYARLKGNI